MKSRPDHVLDHSFSALYSVLCGLLIALLAGPVYASRFSETLSREQRGELGWDRLSREQQAALDAAIERYRESAATRAAETAVQVYRQREEPGAIARALAKARREQAEERMEKVESRIVGRFTGWDGDTVFRLENGQVWQQTSGDTYYIRALDNPEVTVFKAVSGYWRLRAPDGAWVTVKRVK